MQMDTLSSPPMSSYAIYGNKQTVKYVDWYNHLDIVRQLFVSDV